MWGPPDFFWLERTLFGSKSDHFHFTWDSSIDKKLKQKLGVEKNTFPTRRRTSKSDVLLRRTSSKQKWNFFLSIPGKSGPEMEPDLWFLTVLRASGFEKYGRCSSCLKNSQKIRSARSTRVSKYSKWCQINWKSYRIDKPNGDWKHGVQKETPKKNR